MSTEKGVGERSSSQDSTPGTALEKRDLHHTEAISTKPQRTSPPKQKEEGESSEGQRLHSPRPQSPQGEGKPHASRDEAEPVTRGAETSEPPRQVIAVSVSKGPATFFNLARKFLVTDEMCDLSALEGAIVSAVDAAHLLERSELATIVRVHTSYVTVEPKRRKQGSQQSDHEEDAISREVQPASSSSVDSRSVSPAAETSKRDEPKAKSETTQRRDDTSTQSGIQPARQGGSRGSSSGRELRRARIVITVRRTESYKRWLEENPLQAIIAGDADVTDSSQTPGGPKQQE